MSLTDVVNTTTIIHNNPYLDTRTYEFTSNSYGYGSVEWQKRVWEKLIKQEQEKLRQSKMGKPPVHKYEYIGVDWAPKGETVLFKIGDRVEVKEGFKNAGKVGYYQGRSLLNKDTHLVRFEGKNKDTKVVLDALQLKPYTREEKAERLVEDFAFLTNVNYSPNEINALVSLLLADGVVLP